MKLYLCSVYDHKSGAYSNPQCFRSMGEAIRSFSDAVTTEGSAFNRHAGDYSFFRIGVFSDETAVIDSDVVRVCGAVECLPKV